VRNVGNAFKAARVYGQEMGILTSQDSTHRRGSFIPLASGVSFGGGQTAWVFAIFPFPFLMTLLETREFKPHQGEERNHR
jgi:hypothetical protein